MSDILVTVVIPAYYRPELLEKAVRSCLAQSMPPDRYEIIVVDSSGSDVNARVVSALAAEAPCALELLTKEPEGPGPSRNLGARHARGEIVAFMDSDCQASPEWLRAGVAAFDSRTGLVQGRTAPEPGAPYSVLNRSFEIRSENFIYEALNIFYRREAFLALGGFAADPDPTSMAVLGGEDVDLAWRVKRAGWQSRFAEEAVVTHIVEKVTPWRWLYDRRMSVVPRIPRDFPETRQFFYKRYFYDDTQAWLVLAMVGAGLAVFWPVAWVAALPYVVRRSTEHTRALRGPLRLLRPLIYLPRDLLTFAALVRGCIRYRTVLL